MRILVEVDKRTKQIKVHADALRSSGQVQYSIVGAGRLRTQWIDERSALSDAEIAEALQQPEELSMRINGGLLLAVVDPVECRAVFVNDPLGAASVLLFENEERALVSSDIDLIVARARELGITLHRDARSMGYRLVTGVTGMGWTPYRGVELLPLFTVLAIEHGVVVRRSSGFRQVVDEARAATPAENLSAIQRAISANVSALESSDRTWKVCHLTGGFDSRLVLSFIRAQHLERSFAFACHGTPAERDREVFEALSKEFGLPVAPSRYLSVSGGPRSFEEEITLPLDFSSGMSLVGPTKYSVPQDGLIASGGYGEMLRSSYWNRINEAHISGPSELLQALYGGNIASFGGSFIRDEFLEAQGAWLWESFQQGLELGLRHDGALEFVYLHRNRMFVGQQSHLYRSVVTRVDPLYSVRSAAYGITMSAEDRFLNTAGIQLMRSNAPELLNVPFDSERLTDEQRLQYSLVLQPTWSYDPSVELDVVGIPTLPTIDPPRRYMPKATTAQIEFAREKKASLRQVVWAEPVRKALRNLVDSHAVQGEFLDVFDVPKIERVLSAPFQSRVVIRSMINIYALLLWFAKD